MTLVQTPACNGRCGRGPPLCLLAALLAPLLASTWVNLFPKTSLQNKGPQCKPVRLVQSCTMLGDFRQLVRFIEDRSSPVWKGYLFSLTLFLSMQLQSIFFHQLWHQSTSLGLRIRTSLISAVFRKVAVPPPLFWTFAPILFLLSSER